MWCYIIFFLLTCINTSWIKSSSILFCSYNIDIHRCKLYIKIRMYSFFLLLYFSNKKERHTCLKNKISRTANHVAFIMFLKFFFLRDKLFMKCWHLFFLPKSGCNIDFLPHLVILAIGIIFCSISNVDLEQLHLHVCFNTEKLF